MAHDHPDPQFLRITRTQHGEEAVYLFANQELTGRELDEQWGIVIPRPTPNLRGANGGITADSHRGVA